ncbi:Scr1 family TA system antitoxin-like transcriptional regulator [Streptomyces sp. NBC_00670]|uniref:Scr1 family TA system antitoxin-like transcriptional regulator n=1 Tax=Streptomyces sp. NBC_00670 TaxID=2975804 RepID=UPI002E2F9D11|nr:Scr1 family TA system antitoxin-like transcriptional regulator [Streptomyces sp. NBC_00670]
MSKVETGRMVPSFDVLDRLLEALGLDESTAHEVRDLLAAVVAAAGSDQLADNLAPVAASVDEEVRSARQVRSFQCVILPTMLQSAEYARHVFESAPGSPPDAVGRAVAARVARPGRCHRCHSATA